MVRNEARVGHVQKLRTFAKAAGVETLPKEDASRVLVTTMMGNDKGGASRA